MCQATFFNKSGKLLSFNISQTYKKFQLIPVWKTIWAEQGDRKMLIYTYLCTNGACRYIEKKGFHITFKCPRCGWLMRLIKTEKMK